MQGRKSKAHRQTGRLYKSTAAKKSQDGKPQQLGPISAQHCSSTSDWVCATMHSMFLACCFSGGAVTVGVGSGIKTSVQSLSHIVMSHSISTFASCRVWQSHRTAPFCGVVLHVQLAGLFATAAQICAGLPYCSGCSSNHPHHHHRCHHMYAPCNANRGLPISACKAKRVHRQLLSCMCMCVYMHVHVCVHVHAYVNMYVMCAYICMHAIDEINKNNGWRYGWEQWLSD